MGESGATYGLKYQIRSLAAVKGGNKKSRWLVGTNSLREDNEVWFRGDTETQKSSLRACQPASPLRLLSNS